MPTLVEVREELDAKRKQLAEVFKEAGPELDLTKVTKITGEPGEKAAEIRKRNDELTALGKSFDELMALDAARKQNQEALVGLNAPVRTMPLPSGVQDGATPAAQGQKSIGRLFVESAAYKGYDRAQRRGPSADIPIGSMLGQKAVLTETGFAPQAIRIGLIQPGALRRPVVADLMPQGTTTQNAIVYMEETTTTNAAAAVTEGNAKPESTLAFTERTAPVRKIATVLPITDELLQDVPALEAYVEARLRLFLALEEERELYGGTGTPPELRGILNFTGVLTQARGTDNQAAAIFKAMINIETTSFLSPSGVVMHPLDWQTIRLMTTSTGQYLWGDPSMASPERVWGIDVVRTPVATQGTALVGAFDTAAQVFRRDQVTFAISDQHADFFIRNQLMLRIEERLSLAVYRPQAFSAVTGL